MGALAFAGAAPALAAPSDGKLTVRVVIDDDLDRTRSDQDIALDGVTVTLTDDSGQTLTKTSDASGIVSWTAAENSLSGGTYRLAVENPDADKYGEATIIPGHQEPQFAPTVSFVDLGAGDQDVSVGFTEKSTLGVAGSTLYSATQRNDIWGKFTNTSMEVYSVPWDFNAALTPTTITTKLNRSTDVNAAGFGIGNTYGVGTDGYHRKIYLGAYAKRGALYGPGGPGAIYRVDPKTGASELYATVANAGTTQHDLDDYQDLAFRTAVGRESLGDVEVSLDGKWLSALNLNTDSVVTYPIQDGTNPAPAQTLKIEPQGGCSVDWTPFALEEKDGITYIGATCGGTGAVYVISYKRGANGALTPTGDVLSADPMATADRPDNQYGPNQNLLDPSTNQRVCWSVKWLPWTDEVPANCLDSHYKIGETTNSDGTKTPIYQETSAVPEAQSGAASHNVISAQFVLPQPMLADMELTDAGWVLSFRDRGSDQYASSAAFGERTDGAMGYATYIASGDIVSTTQVGNTLTLGTGAKYNDTAANMNTGNGTIGYGSHYQGAYAGIAYVDGQDKIAGNQMDASQYYTSGMRQYDINTGRNDPNSGGPQAIKNTRVTGDFSKGAGLADLEVMVRYATQQIGNRLWIDSDRDGIQDPSEPPVAGVQVSLYDADGELVATTETDANGEYYFDVNDGVKPGVKYEVRLDRAADFADAGPLKGHIPTKTGAGSDDGIDNNGAFNSAGIPIASVTTAKDGSNDHSIDFGFVQAVSIGNKLWIDKDGDGQQDADEPAVPKGTEVKLLDAKGEVVATTTTDDEGNYVFANLVPDTEYTVVFPATVKVGEVVYALTKQGSEAGSDTDSNPDPTSGEAKVTTPKTGNNSSDPDKVDDPTIDAGYKKVLVSIGDYLWIDADGNGVQDAGEPVVPEGTEVKLRDADGNVVTTTTDANGYYAFKDLDPSTEYTVIFPKSVQFDGKAYALTAAGAGTDKDKDSNPNADGEAKVTTPATGKNSTEPGKADDPSIDAGYKPVVSIGDYLWIDANNNGIQDDDENPVPAGTPVKLLDADGNEVASTTTDADGYYAFKDLSASTKYIVEFPKTVLVDGAPYSLTQTGAGDDESKDSNADRGTGRAEVTTPTAGNNSVAHGEADVPTIDAGYSKVLVSIGDYLWIDSDNDGVQDDGEPVVPEGTTVKLLDKDGNEVASTTTDASGFYVFKDLAPSSDYTVVFPTTVEKDGVKYALTEPGAGDDESKDSNADQGTGQAKVKTPASGNNSDQPGDVDVPTIDAGYTRVYVSIGDYLWIDVDGNGVQDDATDIKVPAGTEVKLLDKDGNEVATTTTDADGYYAFKDLDPETEYTVVFPGSVTVGDQSYALTAPGAGTDEQADSNPADQGEKKGQATVTTPASGKNSTGPGKADDPSIDAGYKPVVSIGDYLWIDLDGNGVQDDATDIKVPAGTEVKLLDKDGNEVATTTTDADGYYAFTDLTPNTDYIVQFPTTVTVDGQQYTLTAKGAGSDESKDSNADSKGRAPVTTPAGGKNSAKPGEADVPSIDAGFEPVVSIGNQLWIDADSNGVLDEGEKPVPAGTPVVLKDKDGNTVAETTTDDEGFYVFTGLKPGTEYIVEFPTSVVVDGQKYELTGQSTKTGEDNDSDADLKTGQATVTTPSKGMNSSDPRSVDDKTIDAGFKPVVSIGNQLWLDANGNGTLDDGEKPVPAGTVVTLLDKDGKKVAETMTNDEGFYVFTGLKPGAEYIVEFPTSVTVDGQAYALTTQAKEQGKDNDSDADPKTGQATVTTPSKGMNSGEPKEADDPSIDAGYKPVVSIGNQLWLEKGAPNGTLDKGEKPVPAGTAVILLDKDGKKVAETTTDADGYYVFTGLTPGAEYTVKFPTSITVDGTTYKLTTQATEQGKDNDSDADPTTGDVKVTAPAAGLNSSDPKKADDPTIDAGFQQVLVSIGNKLWLDENANGVQDGSEKPVAGATVTLKDKNGKVVATTKTDKDGNYVFAGLLPNTEYTVEFPTVVTVDGRKYALTTPGTDAKSDTDSNADPATGSAKVTTPADGNNSTDPSKADDPTIDAGYKPLVSIGDKLWIDKNGNGVQDKGEPGVPGATVKLLDENGKVIATTKTDANGNYSFTDLDPNTKYTVVFPVQVTVDGKSYTLTKPHQGKDGAADSNADVTTGEAPVTSPKTGVDATIDAGYVETETPKVSIGDKLWIDKNGNGIQDKGEPGVPGAEVKLLDENGNVIATTKTDSKGNYLFTGLEPNTKYTVVFSTTVTVDGVEYKLTQPTQGVETGRDSNADPVTGEAAVVSPKSGEDVSIDAGYVAVDNGTGGGTDEPTGEPTGEPTDGSTPTTGTTQPGDNLVNTGFGTPLWIAFGALLLVAAGGVLLGTRRRGRH